MWGGAGSFLARLQNSTLHVCWELYAPLISACAIMPMSLILLSSSPFFTFSILNLRCPPQHQTATSPEECESYACYNGEAVWTFEVRAGCWVGDSCISNISHPHSNWVGGVAKPTPGGAVPAAANPSYDDSKWRELNVPHDYVIEGTFDKQYVFRMRHALNSFSFRVCDPHSKGTLLLQIPLQMVKQRQSQPFIGEFH